MPLFRHENRQRSDEARRLYAAFEIAYTIIDFAAALSEIAGREIPYVNMSEADYAAALEGAGLPVPVAQMLADSDNGAAQGGLFSENTTLSTLIGRPTTPWKDTLAAGVKVES